MLEADLYHDSKHVNRLGEEEEHCMTMTLGSYTQSPADPVLGRDSSGINLKVKLKKIIKINQIIIFSSRYFLIDTIIFSFFALTSS